MERKKIYQPNREKRPRNADSERNKRTNAEREGIYERLVGREGEGRKKAGKMGEKVIINLCHAVSVSDMSKMK